MSSLKSFSNYEPPPFDQVPSGSVYLVENNPESSFDMFNSTDLDFTPFDTSNWNASISTFSNSTANTTTNSIFPTDPSAYFGDVFFHLNYQYRQVHGELSLAVCVFGIIANVLNIIVLSRKNMISPTNAILTGMAVSDLVVIACYIPFVIHNFMRHSVPIEEMFTYGWAVYTLVHAHVTVVFHTISIWLTVLLAVWRYTTVRSPASNKSSCSMARARVAIVCTYFLVPLFCIPVFVCFAIYPFEHPAAPSNATLWKVDMIKLDSKHKYLLEKINFWAFGIILKLIPCILLTCLSLALVRILIEARKRKERLLGGNFNHHHHHHHQHRNGTSTSASEQMNHNRSNHHHRESIAQSNSPQLTRGGRSLMQQPQAVTQVYLEIADNSPTEYDQTSKSSKGSELGGGGRWLSVLRLCNPLTPKGFRHPLRKCSQCCTTSSSSFCCCPCISRPPTAEVKLKLKTQTVVVNAPPVSLRHRRHKHSHRMSHSSGNSERTTRMLIAVLIMFLICEFPAGILALLSGILGKVFFTNVYNNFGEIMDMLALINSAVNFVLYCLMSQQFRKTFSQLFCIRWTEEVSSGGGGGVIGTRSGGGGRNSTQFGGGGRRISNRPEATVATEVLGSPVEERREMKEVASFKPNGSAPPLPSVLKPVNNTSHSTGSSTASSSGSLSDRQNCHEATKPEAIELVRRKSITSPTSPPNPCSPTAQLPAAVSQQCNKPTANFLSQPTTNNSSLEDVNPAEHKVNSIVLHHVGNGRSVHSHTTVPDSELGSYASAGNKKAAVQRLSARSTTGPRPTISAPTAECELVINSINCHLSTTSV